jgi:hypothetical protein
MLLLPRPACGERVGVRGLMSLREIGGRGDAVPCPSPAALKRGDLSPRKSGER